MRAAPNAIQRQGGGEIIPVFALLVVQIFA
jgi:hypothetical protein